MRGLLSAINLFLSVGLAYVVNLAVSAVITDPHLVWDFGAPTILGAVVTVFFVRSLHICPQLLELLLTLTSSTLVFPLSLYRQGRICSIGWRCLCAGEQRFPGRRLGRPHCPGQQEHGLMCQRLLVFASLIRVHQCCPAQQCRLCLPGSG